MIKFITAALSIWLSSGIYRCEGQSVIYTQDFNQYTTDALYTEEDLEVDWLDPKFEKGVREGRVEIVTGEVAAGRSGACLAVSVPLGSVGTNSGGALWPMRFPTVHKTLKLTYRVKFLGGFDFVRGGKLPGLAGGVPPTGNDFSNFEDGWSGRLMWRTDDLTPDPATQKHLKAHLIHYLKHPTSGLDMAGQDEDHLYWADPSGNRVLVEGGKWYTITQVIEMNTPGQQDGRVVSWLDGVKTYDGAGFEFRNTLEKGIDVLYFNVFFGGGGSSYAATRDEVIYFDDFKVEAFPQSDVMDFTTAGGIAFPAGKLQDLPVSYTASAGGYLNINLFTGNGAYLSSASKFVEAGTNSLLVPILVPSNAPAGPSEFHGYISSLSGDWQNVRDWTTQITGNTIVAQQPVSVDTLGFSAPPQKLVAGQSADVFVNYDAVTDGTISVSLMDGSGSWISGGQQFVSAGSGFVSISVPVPAGTQPGGYEFHSFLATVPGDWQNARVYAFRESTNVVNEPGLEAFPEFDSMSFTAVPAQISAGQTINVDVSYDAACDGYLNISLISSSGAWVAGGEKFVGAGSGMAQIPINVGGSAAPGSYDFHGFVSTVQSDWQNSRFWAPQATTTIVSGGQ